MTRLSQFLLELAAVVALTVPLGLGLRDVLASMPLGAWLVVTASIALALALAVESTAALLRATFGGAR